jgi:hypothetical protein
MHRPKSTPIFFAGLASVAALTIASPAASEWNIQVQQAQERAAMEDAMRNQPQGCPEGSRDLGTGGCMFPSPPAYAVIASHPDAADVWVAAMYPNRDSAWNAALLQCGKVMGGGCEWGWSVNRGPIGAALGADGTVHWAVGQDKKAVQKFLEQICKPYELGCQSLGFYHGRSEFRGRRKYKDADNIRYPADPNMVRKIYGAVSYMPGNNYDGKSWIASGYGTREEAEKVALNVCKMQAKLPSACVVGSSTGNGVLAFYVEGDIDSVMVEQSEARARQAIAQKCARLQKTCTVRHIYNARASGIFENKNI